MIAIGIPVSILGMRVARGDLVHADRHGALVNPVEKIPALKAVIGKVVETEAMVLGPARAPGFDIETLERV